MAGYVIWPYDCVDTMLHILDEKSVHCVVTSPPYFGLRDYNHDGQIGREHTLDEYVAKLVAVGRAIRRVLRDDGTFWLNIGDAYATGTKAKRQQSTNPGVGANRPEAQNSVARIGTPEGLKTKDLIGIPWRVALALQADGWYLRQDIIWDKPNTMPESVNDRFTKSYEHVFLLTKQPRYFFDQEAVKEPSITGDIRRPYTSQGARELDGRNERHGGKPRDGADGTTRRKRDVWSVPTQPYGGNHYAAFPPKLAEPCILAGSPPTCCAACGAPRVGRYERTEIEDTSYKGSTFDKGKTGERDGGDRTQPGPRFIRRHIGYFPSCGCNAPDAPATVLDPFGGTGTTAMVAIKHGRQAVLCEINPEYIEVARKRIAGGK